MSVCFFACLVPKKWQFWKLVFFKAFPELFVKFFMVQASGYFELSLQFLLTKRVFEVFSCFLFLISIRVIHIWIANGAKLSFASCQSFFWQTLNLERAHLQFVVFLLNAAQIFARICFLSPSQRCFSKSKKFISSAIPFALEQARYQISFCPLLFYFDFRVAILFFVRQYCSDGTSYRLWMLFDSMSNSSNQWKMATRARFR